MVIKRIFYAALLVAGLMSSASVCAQSTETRWEGNIPSTSLNDKEVFLYNVGTGRFLVHGGDWGVQARLFYNDSGKLLTMRKVTGSGNNVTATFDTGQTTLKDGKQAHSLCCNIPGVTDGDDWNDATGGSKNKTYSVIMDGYSVAWSVGQYSGNDFPWHFVKVTDPDESGNNTYYMYNTHSNTNYYMGAVYGTNGPLAEGAAGHDGDDIGNLVKLSSSYDKVVWTTYSPTGTTVDPFTGNSMDTEVSIFNEETKVKIKKLYQWRIVTKEELLATLKSGDVGDGLSTNLTYLIDDRGFERNDFSFFEGTYGWNANTFTDVNYQTSGEGRYLYTWGYVTGTAEGASRKTQYEDNSNSYYNSRENYLKPVRLKAQFDGKASSNFSGKPEAKFGFMEFEGVGTVSTYITTPEHGTGVYRIAGYGFCQSENNNDAYFFATTRNPAELSKEEINAILNGNEDAPTDIVLSAPLIRKNGFDKSIPGTYGDRTYDNYTGVIKAGYDFVWNKSDYRRELEIFVEENNNVYFGVLKLEASKSDRYTSGRTNYYYDKDWVGADQFEIVYLGSQNAVWFDDRNNTYYDNNDIVEDIKYKNRAVRFHRTFAQGQWNSFVFPMNLTAVQVRHAFGDGTKVAVLHGLGTLSGNKEIIDFKSIALPAEGAAITAGQMYIIKPKNGPLTSSENDPYDEGQYRTYYDMGNATFNSSDLPATPDDSYWVSDKGAGIGTAGGATVAVKAHATYFNGKEIPAGSYVLGQHKTTKKYNMYYLTSKTTIKGFRGWITDDDNVLRNQSKSISINGVFDETDAIDGLTMDERLLQNGAIYDLSGRKVGAVANMSQLPKGLYIVNGKKYVVK